MRPTVARDIPTCSAMRSNVRRCFRSKTPAPQVWRMSVQGLPGDVRSDPAIRPDRARGGVFSIYRQCAPKSPMHRQHHKHVRRAQGGQSKVLDLSVSGGRSGERSFGSPHKDVFLQTYLFRVGSNEQPRENSQLVQRCARPGVTRIRLSGAHPDERSVGPRAAWPAPA